MTTATLPVAASDVSSLELSGQLAALQNLDLHGLRIRWRKLFRNEAPTHLGRALLIRILAYKMQARVFGDLDAESVRFLQKINRERLRRHRAGEHRPKQVPPVPAVIARHTFAPGTQFIRSFGGEDHLVTMSAEGFVWKNKTFTSLSEIARQITGTSWNGPRFFGLREKPKSERRTQGASLAAEAGLAGSSRGPLGGCAD